MHGFHIGPQILIRVIALHAIMILSACTATDGIQQAIHNGNPNPIPRYRHWAAWSPLIRHWIISVDPVAIIPEKSRVILLAVFYSLNRS